MYSEGWSFCCSCIVGSCSWNVGPFLSYSPTSKISNSEKKLHTLKNHHDNYVHASWKLFPCHAVFIYVCLQTFMVMCDYEVSLVFIRVFFPHNFFLQGDKEREKGIKEKDSGGIKTEVGTWEDGWDERNETRFALQMHILINYFIQLTMLWVHVRKCDV